MYSILFDVLQQENADVNPSIKAEMSIFVSN